MLGVRCGKIRTSQMQLGQHGPKAMRLLRVDCKIIRLTFEPTHHNDLAFAFRRLDRKKQRPICQRNSRGHFDTTNRQMINVVLLVGKLVIRAFARARSSLVRMLSNADAAVFLTQAL